MTAQFRDHLWPLWRHAAHYFIFFVLLILVLIFHISTHPPSLNVQWGHLQEQVMFCFLRSVAVGILSAKLLHCWTCFYMCVRQSQQQEKMCKLRHGKKRKPVFSIRPSSGSCSGVKTPHISRK